MHQEAITRAAIRNINISQRRNEREKPHTFIDNKIASVVPTGSVWIRTDQPIHFFKEPELKLQVMLQEKSLGLSGPIDILLPQFADEVVRTINLVEQAN